MLQHFKVTYIYIHIHVKTAQLINTIKNVKHYKHKKTLISVDILWELLFLIKSINE